MNPIVFYDIKDVPHFLLHNFIDTWYQLAGLGTDTCFDRNGPLQVTVFEHQFRNRDPIKY